MKLYSRYYLCYIEAHLDALQHGIIKNKLLSCFLLQGQSNINILSDFFKNEFSFFLNKTRHLMRFKEMKAIE